MDLESKRLEKVFDDPGYHNIQARPLVGREEPDGRSSVLTPDEPLGKFYCLNVYRNDFKDQSWMPPGSAKRLRVVEGIPQTSGAATATPGGAPQLAPRRILGEVPVAGDGSFSVEVPANTPVQLQLLDSRGLTLRSCGWIWTRNHEPQGCIGCHEDGELTPTNVMVDALIQGTRPAHPPVHERTTVDFRRDVLPIVAKKCSGCHGPGGSPPQLASTDANSGALPVYEALLARDGAGGRGDLRWKYVHPGSARTSPLAWHVLGLNTSRPWDGPAAARPAKPIPPGSAEPLSDEETAMLVRWIDLGAGWQGASASAATR